MLCFESSGETDGLVEIQEKDFRNQESFVMMKTIGENKKEKFEEEKILERIRL